VPARSVDPKVKAVGAGAEPKVVRLPDLSEELTIHDPWVHGWRRTESSGVDGVFVPAYGSVVGTDINRVVVGIDITNESCIAEDNARVVIESRS
jgi:hypothetical protein